jgi:erythromycin esterase-like protein
MADTLDRLMAHHGPTSRGVVWEHNTHVGDARGTDMAAAGMVNIGQLVRERHEADGVVLVGFGGHHGHVIAASSWGAPMRRMKVPPAPAGSHEDLLSATSLPASLLVFPARRDTPWLAARRGHRAIGVVYDPRRDRLGNWVPTVMGRRYDAFCSFGTTDALHPLHLELARPGEEHETEPWGT